MSVKMRLLTAAMALCAAALSAWSIPTLYGDTGLIQVPTAEVQAPYDFNIAAGYARLLTGDEETTILPVRATYGLAPKMEVFALYAATVTDDAANFEIVGGGVKWQFMAEDVLSFRPGAAAGVRAVRDVNNIDFTEVYGVVSKTILARGNWHNHGYAFLAHAGVTYTTYSDPLDATFVTPFLGVEYRNSAGTTIMVDAIAEHEDAGIVYRKQSISGAIRQPLSEVFTLDLGYTRPFGEPNSEDKLYLSFNYRYDASAY